MNNSIPNPRKYLVVGIGVLICLLILVSIVQSLLRQKSYSGQNAWMTPTPIGGGVYQRSQLSKTDDQKKIDLLSPTIDPLIISSQNQLNEVKQMLPLETEDFVLDYSPNLDKLVVTRKTENADDAFSDWAIEKGYPLIVNNNDTTIVSDKSMEEVQTPHPTRTISDHVLVVVGVLSNVLNPNFELKDTRVIISPTPQPSEPPKSSSSSSSSSKSKPSDSYVYYPQCNGPYDKYPLASGCDVCQAGCGPTTVAMILSTYIDKKYDPPAVVDIYKTIGGAACGTGLSYAKTALSSRGVKTSDYILPYTGTEHDIKEVADDFRSYIESGWTLFALAHFKPGAGGHYFWITNVDEKGSVYAYDPYYGSLKTPPINENTLGYSPFPKYMAVFGVRK